ncbi:hypothetical protein ABPG75_009419 [Micractinium tetrahymenae]
MAVARLRTARNRRQTGWLQLVVFGVVAVVGGTALWTSLQYSEAHAAARASAEEKQLPAQESREVPEQPTAGGAEGDEARGGNSEGGAGGASDPAASLAAWTEITTLPTGNSGSAVTGSSKPEGEQQQGQQQPGEQAKEEQPAAAGGGPKPGDKLVTVELRVPKMPPTFNSWVLSEDMLLFHRRALQQQLEQAYVALGLAAAAGRAFVLPEFSCFCQNSEAPLPRCRRPDSEAVQFPVPCPEGEVLQPLEKFAEPQGGGMPLRVLPHAALHSMELDESKVLVLKPSATVLWPACAQANADPNQQVGLCTYESGLESGATQLVLPPSLNDTHLLPFLEKYQGSYPLWRLDLSDIGSHWHAFAGWDCAEPARQFDLRLRGAAQPWPAPSGGGMQAMNMTSGRVYSDEPDMKDCPGGAALRRMQAVHMQA